jgi:FMN phosphatase YigB (HAD superfamily)
MKKHYKILFFDWHKTLSHCDFWGQLKDSVHDRNHWHENIVRFLFTENKSLVNRWMRGETNEDQILDLVSRTFDYPKEMLREDLAESCQTMTLLSDQILPLIALIRKKGIRCVIATDNMDVFRKYVVPALKLDEHFNETLVSCDQKALKFDTSEDETSIPFFHNYLKKNGLDYADALLLDDRVDTSGLYKKLGFDTFQVEGADSLLEKLRALSA